MVADGGSLHPQHWQDRTSGDDFDDDDDDDNVEIDENGITIVDETEITDMIAVASTAAGGCQNEPHGAPDP